MDSDFVDGGYGSAGVGAVPAAPLCAHSGASSASCHADSLRPADFAKVVATDPDPVLDISSVAPLGDGRSAGHSETNSKIKLVCHLPGTCLPFYAIVSWPAETVGHATSALSASPAVAKTALKPNSEITIRAGAHATLVMDDDRAHIQVAVISLENGIAGHRIRVASPDRKQVYVAEVVSAKLLKGSF